MNLHEPTTLAKLIKAFNRAENAKDRLAFAAAIRVEIGSYAATLDDDILPVFQKAVVDETFRSVEEKQ